MGLVVGYSSATLVNVVAVHAVSLMVGVVVVAEDRVRVLLPAQSDCVVFVGVRALADVGCRFPARGPSISGCRVVAMVAGIKRACTQKRVDVGLFNLAT